MSLPSSKTRDRIEAQGFLGLSDCEISHLNYWLRVAPAACMLWTAAGTWMGSHRMLYVLLPFAVMGAVMRTHPFDFLYNRVFRFYKLIWPPMPTYGKPRRFACLAASIMLTVTAAAFHTGFANLGYFVGSVMVSMAAVNVLTGFCIPSFIYASLNRISATGFPYGAVRKGLASRKRVK